MMDLKFKQWILAGIVRHKVQTSYFSIPRSVFLVNAGEMASDALWIISFKCVVTGYQVWRAVCFKIIFSCWLPITLQTSVIISVRWPLIWCFLENFAVNTLKQRFLSVSRNYLYSILCMFQWCNLLCGFLPSVLFANFDQFWLIPVLFDQLFDFFRSVVVTCYSISCLTSIDQLWLHVTRSVVWLFSISCGCMLFDQLSVFFRSVVVACYSISCVSFFELRSFRLRVVSLTTSSLTSLVGSLTSYKSVR